MPSTPQVDQPTKYCRKCSYDLSGLEDHRCPECGRPFDPANPRTYLRRPRGRWHPASTWLLKAMAVAGVSATLGLVAGGGWLAWRSAIEQRATEAFRDVGVNPGTTAMARPQMRAVAARFGIRLPQCILSLNFEKTRARGSVFAHLRHLRDLRHLSLTNGLVTDSDLVHVRNLSRLSELRVVGAFTDAGLSNISRLENLQSLMVQSPNVTDAGLVHLAELWRLKWLSINGAKISAAGLESLKGLWQLQSLVLDGTSVTGAGLFHLSDLPYLSDLRLKGPNVSDASLAHLKCLRHLRSLTLDGAPVTDRGLVHSRQWASLTHLSIQNTPVTDEGLVHLTSLAKLARADLRRTRVTKMGIIALQEALPGVLVFWP